MEALEANGPVVAFANHDRWIKFTSDENAELSFSCGQGGPIGHVLRGEWASAELDDMVLVYCISNGFGKHHLRVPKRDLRRIYLGDDPEAKTAEQELDEARRLPGYLGGA